MSLKERFAQWRRRTAPVGQPVTAEPVSDLIVADAVFTPTSPANKTFVPRKQEQKLLKQALETRGTQIVLYGESGAGKSSLAMRVLADQKREHIVTRCTSTSTYEGVIKSAFDKLGAFAVTAKTTRDSVDVHLDTEGKAGNDIVGSVTIKGGVAYVVEQSAESERVVEYQITAENLATALSKRQLSWVVEDFHKVSAETRTELADLLKVFSDQADPNTAVVILGASETASEVVSAPADMRERLAQIPVPPLNDSQLGEILDGGGNLMHVDFSAVRAAIIRTSAGVASTTHALALRCLQELDVRTPPDVTVEIAEVTLRAAARSYASSMQGGMREAFEKAMFRKKTRIYDNCAIILKAIASLPESGGTHAEILAEIKKTHAEYPASNLTAYLPQLASEERGALIRKTAAGRHRFDKPLQHTFAQITFDLDPGEDDLFADELVTTVSEQEKERAIGAANDSGEGLPE